MIFDFNRLLIVNSYKCNMNCPYCMHANYRKEITEELSLGLDNSKNFIDFFIKNTPYDKIYITFSGGEPLIFYEDYLKPIILYIREKEKYFNKTIILDVFTNGSLLTEEMCYFFKKTQFKVGFSYDGLSCQSHRDKKTQQQVENNIRMALNLIPDLVSTASTFDKETISNIYKTYLEIKELGIKKWSFALDTLTYPVPYTIEDLENFGDQINKIWKEYDNNDIYISVFNKIKEFSKYINSNKSLIIRPNGDINIGTNVPVLIPEKYMKYLLIGKYVIDENKLLNYQEKMGNFHLHVLGKNNKNFCEQCYVKKCCQFNDISEYEKQIREESHPIHCLYYLILSSIMENQWE